MAGMEGSRPVEHNPDGPPEQLTSLNYAFSNSSEGGIPSPLPLATPLANALLKAPAASIRSFLVENLESEGITVKARDMRLWRTRIPLDPDVAVNDWHAWLKEAAGGGQKVFVAIPFTKSIWSSLTDEWISNENLVHFLVTDGGPPFNIRTGMQSSDSIIAATSVVLGTYHMTLARTGRQTAGDVREGERHSTVIQVPSAPRSLAGSLSTVLLGLCYLDAGSPGSEIQVMFYTSDIYPDSFTIHLGSFGSTRLYLGYINWMAIYPHESLSPLGTDPVQWGTVDSQSTHIRKTGRRYMAQRVQFRQAYEQTPNVFSCLSGLTVGGSGSSHWDIRTFVTGIDRCGFTMHIEKPRDSEKDVNEVVAHAQVNWIAFPGSGMAAGREMSCGQFQLEEGVRTEKEKGRVEWKGKATFSKEFASPPLVFAAFKSFDVNKSTTVRIKLDVVGITRQGIEWAVEKMNDTVLYSATGTFLAIGDT